jgi:acyl-CoA thioester hydrolase
MVCIMGCLTGHGIFKYMEKRIFYHDTDAGGIVYYGQYLCYLEEARTEFLEKKGMSVQMFKERGLVYAVRQCNVSYRSPARYGDTLICDAKLKKVGAAQLVFDQTIHHKEDGRLMVEAEVSLVCLNSDFKPVVIPDDLKAKLEA